MGPAGYLGLKPIRYGSKPGHCSVSPDRWGDASVVTKWQHPLTSAFAYNSSKSGPHRMGAETLLDYIFPHQ